MSLRQLDMQTGLPGSGSPPRAPPSSNCADILWNSGSTAKARSNFLTFNASQDGSSVAEGLESTAARRLRRAPPCWPSSPSAWRRGHAVDPEV